MKTVTKTFIYYLMAASFLLGGCGSSSSDTSTTAAAQPQSAGWYMQTSVTATAANGTVYRHTTAGVFGELAGSSAGKDNHDIPGYGSAVLQVVFPQTAWGSANGDYFSDYRAYNAEDTNISESWVFQVKNQQTVDLSNAPISISLNGVFDIFSTQQQNGGVKYDTSKVSNSPLLAELSLVDVDNQKVYSYSQVASAGLKMDGKHTRTFRWVLGPVDAADMQPLTTTSVQTASFKAATPASALKTAPTKFGLPPQ